MFVTYRGNLFGLVRWQWRFALVFLGSAAVVVLGEWLTDDLLTLPAMPLAVIGAALGIFVSFRTNAAYDRWWEGRKLWGSLVNSSRHFATQVLGYLGEARHRGAREALVRRQIAYVHALRCALRDQDPFADQEFLAFVTPEEQSLLRGESNVNHAILDMQHQAMVGLATDDSLNEYRLQSLDRTIAALLDVQGGCERIKRTPFPRGYGFIAERLILAFSFLLPLGLVDELGWITIPMNLLVCMSFALIGEVGRVLEDPFTMFWPALPLSALSRTIEVNLRQRLGESELPPMLGPDSNGILM